MTRLDRFTIAYITATLWSSFDDSDTPLNQNYDLSDISPELYRKIEEDCTAFFAEWGEKIEDEEQAGHDFWLTRNHHGAGFWDRDNLPEPLRTELTDASHKFGEVDLYVGDNEQIYC